MTITDAPGPFASMRALAQYDVVNKQCLSPPKDNPGGHTAPVPTKDVEIPLTRVSDNEYTGVVYADWMQDEDYTGHGRSEEHTSELQSLMRISYAVFCLKKKKQKRPRTRNHNNKNYEKLPDINNS